ncbi:hypothetical protein [Ekhidna sp.]
MSSSRILREALSKVGEISSPQLDAFIPNDMYARPIYFAFRFKDMDVDDPIYLRLINMINQFELGSLSWVMYRFKSKNYVIEPLEFYTIRRKLNSGSDEKLIAELGDNYQSTMKKAIRDLDLLSEMIVELSKT